jgi:hypothetical protein
VRWLRRGAVEMPLAIRHEVGRLPRQLEPPTVAGDELELVRRLLEQQSGRTAHQPDHTTVELARLQRPIRLPDRLLPPVEITGHIHRHFAKLHPAVLRRIQHEDHLPGLIDVIGRLVGVERRRGRPEVVEGKGLVPRGQQRQRCPRPVGIQLDDARRGRAQPGAGDTLGLVGGERRAGVHGRRLLSSSCRTTQARASSCRRRGLTTPGRGQAAPLPGFFPCIPRIPWFPFSPCPANAYSSPCPVALTAVRRRAAASSSRVTTVTGAYMKNWINEDNVHRRLSLDAGHRRRPGRGRAKSASSFRSST